MHMKIHPFGFVTTAALSATFGLSAWAAPQALALMSTEGGVQLTCSGTECAAEFSSYCLQNEHS